MWRFAKNPRVCPTRRRPAIRVGSHSSSRCAAAQVRNELKYRPGHVRVGGMSGFSRPGILHAHRRLRGERDTSQQRDFQTAPLPGDTDVPASWSNTVVAWPQRSCLVDRDRAEENVRSRARKHACSCRPHAERSPLDATTLGRIRAPLTSCCSTRRWRSQYNPTICRAGPEMR